MCINTLGASCSPQNNAIHCPKHPREQELPLESLKVALSHTSAHSSTLHGCGQLKMQKGAPDHLCLNRNTSCHIPVFPVPRGKCFGLGFSRYFIPHLNGAICPCYQCSQHSCQTADLITKGPASLRLAVCLGVSEGTEMSLFLNSLAAKADYHLIFGLAIKRGEVYFACGLHRYLVTME